MNFNLPWSLSHFIDQIKARSFQWKKDAQFQVLVPKKSSVHVQYVSLNWCMATNMIDPTQKIVGIDSRVGFTQEIPTHTLLTVLHLCLLLISTIELCSTYLRAAFDQVNAALVNTNTV